MFMLILREAKYFGTQDQLPKKAQKATGWVMVPSEQSQEKGGGVSQYCYRKGRIITAELWLSGWKRASGIDASSIWSELSPSCVTPSIALCPGPGH